MPTFYALVDAMPGREPEVESGLRRIARLTGVLPCRDRSNDFLVRFDAAAFDVVDDFLATEVRRVPGVKGIEVIVDWDDQSEIVRGARDRLDGKRA